MRLSKPLIALLMLGGISILATSCGARQSAGAAAEDTPVTIDRGDISVDITAAGNLALSVKTDLAFDIPGTVEEVLVSEGDSVRTDQVLARLDTSEWDKQLTALEKALTAAQRQVISSQKSLRDKQNAVISAQNNLLSRQYVLRSAELDLQSAHDAVTQIAEVKRIQDQIDAAQNAIKLADSALASGGDFQNWTAVLVNARAAVKQLNDEMKTLLSGSSTSVSSNVALDVARKQLAVEQKQLGITTAQFDLENAKLAVDDARNAVAPAEEDVQTAQADLATAQKNLDDAKKYGPEVRASFDGFVTKVSVKGGDSVKKGTVAVTVADPAKFEADVLVNETDIGNVRLGSLASVELQSSPGTVLAANVTHIAPTATVQQGVVNYKVTVEVGSPRQAAQGQFRTGASFSANFTPGDIAGLRQAFAAGNMTQEQIDQIRQQVQQAGGGQFFGRGGGNTNLTPEQIAELRQQAFAGAGSAAIQGVPGQTSRSQLSGRASQAARVTLAEGMTVNVSIPVESRANVVRVPNGAITTRNGQTSVRVLNADGTTGDRVIQTGIADYQYTEVVSGLAEGDTVVITRRTSSSASSSRTNQIRVPSGGAIFRP
jgi:multidrug efflux pump subunit AcrA (membrane-fusion protein)